MLLPFVFKFFVTEKSLRWMFNHYIDWDGPVVLNAKEPACGR